jgi:hypothetical protein
MSIFLFAVASYAAIAEAFVVPSLQDVGAARNFTRIETTGVRVPGHLHVPVKRKQHRNPNQKRQSLDGLRNDISGYSIQSEFSFHFLEQI